MGDHTVIPFRRQLTAAEALEVIRSALQNTGSKLGWTDHALEQIEDRGILDSQVLAVLRSATELETNPVWDEKFDDWTCSVRKFVSGRSVTVVVGIEERGQEVTIITAY